MAFRKSGEDIISIECDFCCNDEFVPEFGEGEQQDEEIAWEQAECFGWEKVQEEKSILHSCPKCFQEA
jgi:hypothetical protein